MLLRLDRSQIWIRVSKILIRTLSKAVLCTGSIPVFGNFVDPDPQR